MHQEIILLDVNCDNAVDVLNMSRYELNNFVWILFKGNTLELIDQQILMGFKNLPLMPNCEIFYCFNESNHHSVKQIYKTAADAPLTIEWMGIISDGNDFMDLRSTKITSRRRQNLQESHLAAAMVITSNDTLNHLNDYRYVANYQ